MANYTCMAGYPFPVEGYDPIRFGATVVLLDENDTVTPNDISQYSLVLGSNEIPESSDDMSDVRRKIEATIWDSYPNLDPENDVVTFNWI